MSITLTSILSKLEVQTIGGQVTNWQIENQEILYSSKNLKRSGIPILFPFAGPLKNNIFYQTGLEIPQHGFGRNTNWKSQILKENEVVLTITNQDLTKEMQSAYPFHFQAQIHLKLKSKSLIYTLKVTNLDEKKLPIAPGIHPYFPISHSQKNRLTIENLPEFNNPEINWENPMDGNFYTFEKPIIVNFPSGLKIQISEISKDKDFKHIVVWSQPSSMQDYDFVCIEPFSRENDILNKNPILIDQKTTWEKSIQFKVLKF